MQKKSHIDLVTPAANVFHADCPARNFLDILAEKWVLLTIHSLKSGPARPGELRRKIEGISEKMLTQTLRRLQEFGIVERRSYAEVPPRVEYWLSPLGMSLSEIVLTLDRWVESNVGEIDRLRSGQANAEPMEGDA
jgi:DNA-binding HxlR family transcriptional regulator